MSELVSGEAVVLEMRVARLASRGLALALDVLIQAFTLLVVFLILGAGGVTGFDDALQTAITLLILVLVLVGYPATFETLSGGRTVGKLALGLRVVRTDGGPIRFRHALVRALAGFFVDFWAVGLFGAVAVIVSLCSKNGQRAGDMLAGTFVVRERAPDRQLGPIWMPPPMAAWAAAQRVEGLPNDLALAVRQYLGRVFELSPETVQSLGYRLAVEVSTHLGTPIPMNVPLPTYLASVIAERRMREEAKLRPPVPAYTAMPPQLPPPLPQPVEPPPPPPAGPFAPPS